jgi:hypothetical protein
LEPDQRYVVTGGPGWNLIRDMFGGETGKSTFGKLSKNVGLRTKSIPYWYNIVVHFEIADF